jgi:hypothetical protein
MYIHNHETKNVLAFEYRNLLAGCRVTRFCEFSPIGRGVSLDSFFVNYKSGANIWTMYGFLRCKLCTFLTKRVGLNFGQFFPKLILSPWCRVLQRMVYIQCEHFYLSFKKGCPAREANPRSFYLHCDQLKKHFELEALN